jgi:hypothetical protein
MMKADVSASIERDRLVRHLDLPQGDNLLAVRDECRGIFRPLANNAPPQAIAEPGQAFGHRTLSRLSVRNGRIWSSSVGLIDRAVATTP